MPDLLNYTPFMEIALKEAHKSFREGNKGYGAVVIKDGQVIAEAHDREQTQGDCTSHAEMNAIRLASKIIGHDLKGCKLICTHEPCPMCASAIALSGIVKIVFGHAIKDTIRKGKKRNDIECEEIFSRAGAKIDIRGGLLKENCAILYNENVREEISRLRNIDEAGMDKLSNDSVKKRKQWFEKHKKKFSDKNESRLETAYKIFLEKLNLNKEDAEVVESTEKMFTIHSRNFCPTLESCKILRLDTRIICKAIYEKSMDTLLKQLDKRLSFSRSYEIIRPHADYCEEYISIKE